MSEELISVAEVEAFEAHRRAGQQLLGWDVPGGRVVCQTNVALATPWPDPPDDDSGTLRVGGAVPTAIAKAIDALRMEFPTQQ